MVSGEVLSVNPDTGLAFFICWNPSARPILAQMSLKSLDKFSDLKSEYLKPGVRVACSLSRKAFGSDEIYEISDLEIVDVPITAFKAVPTSKASIVHKNKSNKSAYVLCQIPALSVLSESKIGEWFYAPDEVTVLAEFHGNNDVKVQDLEIGEVVQVNLEWSPEGKPMSLLYDAHNAWKVAHLTRISDKMVDNVSTNSEDVDYFGLNVVSCIARTDHHMYLVVEIVDWNSPDAKLKTCLPKKIPVRGRKNSEELEALDVGMCLVSFFSRSYGEGWVHHFSEIFDSYHWISGKSSDGFRCIDLQGVASVESAERRKFDQTRCLQCQERLSVPQLVSEFNFGQPRLELGYDSKQTLIDPSSKTEEESTLDVDPTPKLDEPADQDLFQNVQNLLSNGKDSVECLNVDDFGGKEIFLDKNDASETTTSLNSSSTIENDSTSTIISSTNNNKTRTDNNRGSNREEVSGSSSFETLTTTETEDSDNKPYEVNGCDCPSDSTNSGGSKWIRVVPEAASTDSDASSILSFRRRSFQNEYGNRSIYHLPPCFRDKAMRSKRFGRFNNSMSSGSLHNGPEIVYKVPAKIVSIDPIIKISFVHFTLSSKSKVFVEVVDEKVKVENKFGSFVLTQQVALTWLRRHLYVDQDVDINAIVDKDVWKILLIRGEFKAQIKPTKPIEKSVDHGSGIQSMPFQEQSAYNPHFSLPPPINAISQQQQMHFNQMQSAYPAHQQHSLVNPPPAMGVCLSQAPSSEVSGGAESVRSSSKFSTVENQCSVDGKKSFNFQDAVKSAKEFVPRQSKLVDTTLSQRSSQKSTTSSLAIRYDPNKPLFKKVQLTSAGEVIHIANIGDKPWVVSAEISRLIPRWNGDILAKMLKLFKESKPTLVYQREQSLRLFEQCINEDLPGVFVGEDIVDSLTFYRLVDVPDILRKYNTSLTDKLLSSVIDEIERFDPNDLHWSGDQQI